MDYIRYVVFKDPKWDWHTFDFEAAVALADRIDNGTTNATNPDLRPFRQRGGKLLLYHGWSDQNFSAQSTIDYYKSVLNAVGSAQTEEWLRLFLAPGMGIAAAVKDRIHSTPWPRSNNGSNTARPRQQSKPSTAAMGKWTGLDLCVPIRRWRNTGGAAVSTKPRISRAVKVMLPRDSERAREFVYVFRRLEMYKLAPD